MRILRSNLSKLTLGLLLPGLASSTLHAADWDIEIENLTRGIHFTPLLVAAHPEGSSIFELGDAASADLQAMAEGGSIAGLETSLDGLGATQSNNPAAGLLAPGESTNTSLDTDGTSNVLLTIAGMILPTNDGFVSLNALEVPTVAGTYTYYARAYDAGTEGNDEIVGSGTVGEAGFPAPAPVAANLGTGGTGLTATAEGFVHVHRGALGDTNNTGGLSDLNITYHRWLNPVAKITITVSE